MLKNRAKEHCSCTQRGSHTLKSNVCTACISLYKTANVSVQRVGLQYMVVVLFIFNILQCIFWSYSLKSPLHVLM